MIPVAQLAAQCAPFVAPKTMTAIVKVESGGNALVLLDNATGRDYYPQSIQQGAAIIRHLLSIGHMQIDVGIAQVDTENFAAYGLTPTTALDACDNIRVGAEILEAAYKQSVATYGPGQVALFHAFEAYNSGRLIGDPAYADKILSAAGIPVTVQHSGTLVYHHVKNYYQPFVLHWTTPKGAKPFKVDARYKPQNLTGSVHW